MSKGLVAVIAAIAIIIGISAGVRTLGLFARAADFNKSVKDHFLSDGGDFVEETIELDRFDKVKTDMASVNFYLEKGDSYKLEYHVYEDYIPQCSVDGGKLVIKQPSVFRVHLGLEKEQYYKLTVSDDAGVLDVNLDSTSGSIFIDTVDVSGKLEITSGNIAMKGINTDKLDLHATSGSIDASDVQTKEVKLHYTSGDVKFNNFVTDKLTVDMTSGDFICDEITFNDADLTATSGNIRIKATGSQDDYGYKLDTTSGTIRIGDMVVTDKFRSGAEKDKQVEVDITSCSMDLIFE